MTSACGCDDSEDIADEVAITFSNLDVSAATRTRTYTDLSTLYEHFIVRGEKVMEGDDKQTVMERYSVRWDASKNSWYYEGVNNGQWLKYWDLTANSYTFTAVTPDPEMLVDKESAVTISTDNKVSITNITGNTTNAVEWMIARTIRTKTPKDVDDVVSPQTDLSSIKAITTFYDEVPLVFHPILSKVDFVVYTTEGVITLTSFKVEANDGQPIKTCAKYDESKDDHWEYTTGYEESFLAESDFSEGMTIGTEPVVVSSRIQLPQTWSDAGLQLEVTCTTDDGKVYSGTVTLNAEKNHTNSWKEGVHYTYRLKINTEEVSDQVILFGVDMDTWKWIEDNTKEDKETNW